MISVSSNTMWSKIGSANSEIDPEEFEGGEENIRTNWSKILIGTNFWDKMVQLAQILSLEHWFWYHA